MKAELITNPYSDLTVVNAARVSFDKQSDYVTNDDGTYLGPVNQLKQGDVRLLKYLAEHNHWTPFSHVRETFVLTYPLKFVNLNFTDIAGMVWCGSYKIRHSIWGWATLLRKGLLHNTDALEIRMRLSSLYPESMKAMGAFVGSDGYDAAYTTPYRCTEVANLPQKFEDNPDFIDITMRETVPIIVARQRFKHMVGFTYNEVSRRYVDDTPDIFYPQQWRSRPEASIKQGSGGKHPHDADWHSRHHAHSEDSKALYQAMIDDGVAPEQARMVLPQSMLTSYYVTGSLSAWKRAYDQRIDPHAQAEIRVLASQWDTAIRRVYPYYEMEFFK